MSKRVNNKKPRHAKRQARKRNQSASTAAAVRTIHAATSAGIAARTTSSKTGNSRLDRKKSGFLSGAKSLIKKSINTLRGR